MAAGARIPGNGGPAHFRRIPGYETVVKDTGYSCSMVKQIGQRHFRRETGVHQSHVNTLNVDQFGVEIIAEDVQYSFETCMVHF